MTEFTKLYAHIAKIGRISEVVKIFDSVDTEDSLFKLAHFGSIIAISALTINSEIWGVDVKNSV